MVVPTGSLARLYFGKDDAESDMAVGGLLRSSFLETAAYLNAKSGKKRLIIGRKGSGKSAICMRLLVEDAVDSGVCMICPDEISSDELRRFDLQGIESWHAKAILWRYVIAVQVAKHIVSHSASLHSGKQPHDVKALRKFLESNGESEEVSFRERFYQIIQRLKTSISLEAFGVKIAAELELEASEGARADRTLEIIENRVRAAILALHCEPNMIRCLSLSINWRMYGRTTRLAITL